MEKLIKTYPIKHRDFVHAGKASIEVKNILKSMKTPREVIRRVAVCGYEGEMNVVMHGSDGSLTLTVTRENLTLEIFDKGPGIPDISLAMQKGYSTAQDHDREMGFGAGMGLPNMKKNANHFNIQSLPGEGTRLLMTFDLGEPS